MVAPNWRSILCLPFWGGPRPRPPPRYLPSKKKVSGLTLNPQMTHRRRTQSASVLAAARVYSLKVASSGHPAPVDPFGSTLVLRVLAAAGKVKGVEGPPRPALLPNMLPGETVPATGGGMAQPKMPVPYTVCEELALPVSGPAV